MGAEVAAVEAAARETIGVEVAWRVALVRLARSAPDFEMRIIVAAFYVVD